MNTIENSQVDYNELIVNYLLGSITPSDRQILMDWIESDKSHAAQFRNLQETWVITGYENEKQNYSAEKAWVNLTGKLRSQPVSMHKTNKPNLSGNFLRLAASWLVFFSLGLSVMYFIKNKRFYLPARPVVITVPLGSKTRIFLPDGSKVWINAGTRLTYNQDYGINTRTLDLSGEAYFDVAKDKSHPFLVNAEGMVIRALGTRFNVKAYPEENLVRTTLEEGRIDIRLPASSGKNRNVVLLPHENMDYLKAEKTILKSGGDLITGGSDTNNKKTSLGPMKKGEVKLVRNINTELYTSWKENRWIIEGEPLGTLAPMLERRFNIKVIFNDRILKNLNFTGTIQNESIDQIMQAMSLTSPIDFKINKDTIFISANPLKQNQFKQIMKADKP